MSSPNYMVQSYEAFGPNLNIRSQFCYTPGNQTALPYYCSSGPDPSQQWTITSDNQLKSVTKGTIFKVPGQGSNSLVVNRDPKFISQKQCPSDTIGVLSTADGQHCAVTKDHGTKVPGQPWEQIVLFQPCAGAFWGSYNSPLCVKKA